jgi:hypothetical protein
LLGTAPAPHPELPTARPHGLVSCSYRKALPTGNPHLILAQHHNQAPNLTLTEIEIQSQKLATTKPSICLFIYTYTHHLILA